jgi:hypothetical protein
MKKRLPLTLLALLALPVAQAADSNLGKDLVEQNCFGSCHETKFYDGSESAIRSLANLHKQVQMCGQAFDWDAAQVDAATAYINESFYHLQ